MQLFGCGRRAQRPPADVDLAERLEGITVRPASPDPAVPDVDEPEARSVPPQGEPTAATGPPSEPSVEPAEDAIPASSASPMEPEGGPDVAATPGALERILAAESARERRYRWPAVDYGFAGRASARNGLAAAPIGGDAWSRRGPAAREREPRMPLWPR